MKPHRIGPGFLGQGPMFLAKIRVLGRNLEMDRAKAP